MQDLRNSFYKFHTWLSIEDNNVKASELNAPRVRTAPDTPGIDSFQIENAKFNTTQVLNLPYQELNEEYQYNKFYGILHSCSDNRGMPIPITGFEKMGSKNTSGSFLGQLLGSGGNKNLNHGKMSPGFPTAKVEDSNSENGGDSTSTSNPPNPETKPNHSSLKILNLQGNKLQNIKNLKYNNLEEAYFQHNLFNNFKDLPKFSNNLKCLDLSDNCIEKLDSAVNNLPKNLVSLTLSRNPVCYTLDYRKRVFVILPNLVYLDGIPKLAADESDPGLAAKGLRSKFGKSQTSRNASVTSVDAGYYS